MNNKVFDIDWNRLILLMMPPRFRKLLMVNWLKSLALPIALIHSDFMANRSANIYKLSHNGQVCYLRKVLNDAFDPEQRRIVIANGNRYTRQYIYTNAEAQPQFLGKMYLRQKDDYADTGVDFRVLLPEGYNLTAKIHQMKALVDFYKLAGKRYKIEFENE